MGEIASFVHERKTLYQKSRGKHFFVSVWDGIMYDELKRKLIKRNDIEALKDCFALCVADGDHETNGEIRKAVRGLGASSEGLELYWKTHLFDAPEKLDSYMLYIEHNRPIQKQFYLPRRKQLKRLVDALQRLEERELTLLGISLAPGVGKTTTAEFFLTWTGGRHPEVPILTGSHSNAFLRGMYGEIQRILDPMGDYLFNDVFPDVHVINTNAQDMMIDLGRQWHPFSKLLKYIDLCFLYKIKYLT